MLATIITITTFNTLLFGHVQVQLWQVKHHFPKFYFVCFVSVLVHKVTRRVIIQKNGLDLFSLQSRDGGIFKANSMLKINKVVLCCQVHAVVGVLVGFALVAGLLVYFFRPIKLNIELPAGLFFQVYVTECNLLSLQYNRKLKDLVVAYSRWHPRGPRGGQQGRNKRQ